MLSPCLNSLGHRGDEAGLGVAEDHAVLRPLRTGERGGHLAEIELERIGKDRIGSETGAVGALRPGVGLDQSQPRRLAAGGLEVGQRLAVDREEAAGRAIFRGHIGDRGAIGDRHRIEARAVELDEFADHALLAQHLGDGQHQIGRGDPLAQFAVQLEADHLGQQHRQRLAEHGRLSLDAADPPAEHRQAIDHGGVAVGADQSVGKGDFDGLAVALLLRRPHGLGEIFEIDLMADAGAGRHDAEVGKGLLAPLQEPVALLVLLVFAGYVLRQRLAGAEVVDHHRMVDDQVDRDQRVDLVGIAVKGDHRIAHRGEIDDRRHAGEILHQHPRRTERDFVLMSCRDCRSTRRPPRCLPS